MRFDLVVSGVYVIEEAGLSFILGARIPDVPWVVEQWRREHPRDSETYHHIGCAQPIEVSHADRGCRPIDGLLSEAKRLAGELASLGRIDAG